jgi:hypothetical protein
VAVCCEHGNEHLELLMSQEGLCPTELVCWLDIAAKSVEKESHPH